MILDGYVKTDRPLPKGKELIEEINKLRAEKNAVILAHFYQPGAIQDLADHLGDSLQLAQVAQKTDADMIVFCGVHFMGETAKILNPTRKVVIPDTNAGCSLADSCKGEDVRRLKEKYPEAIAVSYINCDITVKAESDIIVTSSNAEHIINSIPKDQQIIFLPDKNLGSYLNKVCDRDMILWDGVCIVHEAFSLEKIGKQLLAHPNAKLIAHPETNKPVLNIAEYIGATSGLLKYVIESPHDEFIVATEEGILHEMRKRAPHKKLISAASEDNSCNCSECHFMKLNTLEKLYLCMKYEQPEILLDETLRLKALNSLNKMLELSKKM